MRSIGIVLACLLLGACKGELGECDDSPETAVMARLTLAKCTRCHGSSLQGDDRQGAPAGLDFDRASKRKQWAEEMWVEIEADRMPPPRPAGSGALSSAEKKAMRGWLACGAPDAVVAMPDAGDAQVPVVDDWSDIWPQITGAGFCAGCHLVGSPDVDLLGGGVSFDVLGDPCAVLARMSGVAPVGPACGAGIGPDYIVSGDADASLLVQKLRGEVTCGAPMPFGDELLDAALVQKLADWIDAGAEAAECE